MSDDDANSRTIAALLRERSMLAGRGYDERVAQVDAELKVRGYDAPKDPIQEAPKDPVKRDADPSKQAPQGRSATPPKTAKTD
jgi:hypothetical protein